tara:strand:- start:101 stop:490 length:390 start_codon:yes stop_codon:yes gene_type:complete
MGYKTKSMFHQIGGDNFNFRKKRIPRNRLGNKLENIKFFKGYKARRMRDSDTQIDGYEGRSTHLMADDGDRLAYPSIYKTDSGEWKEQSLEKAKKRGEVFEFKSNKRMKKFAREGNWKNNRFEKNKFLK